MDIKRRILHEILEQYDYMTPLCVGEMLYACFMQEMMCGLPLKLAFFRTFAPYKRTTKVLFRKATIHDGKQHPHMKFILDGIKIYQMSEAVYENFLERYPQFNGLTFNVKIDDTDGPEDEDAPMGLLRYRDYEHQYVNVTINIPTKYSKY